MRTFGERLRCLIEHEKVNIRPTQLAIKTGKPKQTISNYLADRSQPDLNFFSVLVEIMPNLNLKWLITGAGDMLEESEGLSPDELIMLRKQINDLREREREMTTALMSMSKLISKGESAKFKTVCDQPGVSIEKVNGRWSFASKHTHEHTVRFAV